MGIWKTFFNNTRKPEGLLGRCMVDSMNHAHAALADWGLSRLPETGPSQIAELGCGGGRNIRALLRKYPAATITALDYSEISVEKAKRAAARFCREMYPASPLGMVRLIWRPHLKPYISGLARWRVSGRCTAPCNRAAFF